MEDPKIAIARDVTRLFTDGDTAALGAHFRSDAVMFAPEGWPEPGPMRGREEIVAQFARLIEDYSEQRNEVSDLLPQGEWLVGLNRWITRARHSGIESTLDVWFATRFEGGLISEMHYCWSRDEAMQAAGIAN